MIESFVFLLQRYIERFSDEVAKKKNLDEMRDLIVKTNRFPKKVAEKKFTIGDVERAVQNIEK